MKVHTDLLFINFFFVIYGYDFGELGVIIWVDDAAKLITLV